MSAEELLRWLDSRLTRTHDRAVFNLSENAQDSAGELFRATGPGAGRETAGEGLLDLFGAGVGLSGCSTAAVVGAGEPGCTIRLFTTVRTPPT